MVHFILIYPVHLKVIWAVHLKCCNRIKELETELQEVNRPPIEMEKYLLNKFKAELGYCQKARIKTGLGVVKEIIGIIGNIDAAIEKYEESERKSFAVNR